MLHLSLASFLTTFFCFLHWPAVMKPYQESNIRCTRVLAAGYSPALGMQQQQSSHTQAQAVLGTYSPMASHQCGMVQVNTEHPTVSFFVSLEQFSLPKRSVSKFEKCLWSQNCQLSFSVCREVFQCPFPKVKLWPRLGERQVAATWSPHPPTTAAVTLPAALASTPRPGAHSTDDASTAGVIILKFLCELTSFFFTLPHSSTQAPPDNAQRVRHPQSWEQACVHLHTDIHKCTTVPKLNSM